MKTRVITAIVGIIVLIGVMFTFNTLIFNLVIAAITLIAVHEIYHDSGCHPFAYRFRHRCGGTGVRKTGQ